jgi:hypothetical protein
VPGKARDSFEEGQAMDKQAQDRAKQAAEPARHVSSWHVRVDIFEEGDTTTAHAVLVDKAASSQEARSSAVRLPGAVSVPEIGDEVAVARALRLLADQMLVMAAEDISAVTRQPVTPVPVTPTTDPSAD